MYLIRNKCTTVYLWGKQMLLKIGIELISMFLTNFNIYFCLVMHVLLYV